MQYQARIKSFSAFSITPRRKRKLILLMISMLITMMIIVLAACASMDTPKKAEPADSQPAPATAPEDWQPVAQAMGKTGDIQPDGVYKISLPRSDLKVTVRGAEIKPALALGSWVAFKKMGNEAMVMGDLVLTEDEVNPVMLKLQQEGIEQTALHNHLLGESPRVLYMHIHAHGDPAQIAEKIRAALAISKTPFTASGNEAQTQELGIDSKQIDQIIGHNGKVKGGVYQIGVPRAEKLKDSGMDVPNSMGMVTSLNFQPTGGGKAAITGDFVLQANEVNPVIRALRENGIEVTALHIHMLNDDPHLFFMHFWANDDALKLARGLRAAIDKTNSAK